MKTLYKQCRIKVKKRLLWLSPCSATSQTTSRCGKNRIFLSRIFLHRLLLQQSLHLVSGVVRGGRLRVIFEIRFDESHQYYQWPGGSVLWHLLSIGKRTSCVFLLLLLFIPPHLRLRWRSSFVPFFLVFSGTLYSWHISPWVKFQIWIVVTWACSLGGGECLYIVKWWTIVYLLFVYSRFIYEKKWVYSINLYRLKHYDRISYADVENVNEHQVLSFVTDAYVFSGFLLVVFSNLALMTSFCFHSIVVLSASDFRADVAAVPHLPSACQNGETHLLGGSFKVPAF